MAPTTVFSNATLIDGTGRDPKPAMAVVVEEGKLADLILVDGNPVDNISVLESADNVKLVMEEGAIAKRLLP